MSGHSKENTGIEYHKSYCPVVRTIENRGSSGHLECGLRSWGAPKTYSGGHKVKITFIIILKLYFPFSKRILS